jgi:DNA-binding FadR family transcriptional regulator
MKLHFLILRCGLLYTPVLLRRGYSTRAATLAEQIRRRIQAEQLRDGDLFMTEAQLAQEYGVSRSLTREAVGQLRALGLLEGRKRKGLIVRLPNPVQLLSHSLPSLARSEEHLGGLARLRYVLEVGSVELVIANATAAQVERLGELAREFEEVVRARKGGDDEDRVELAFHGLILEMTGTSLIVGMQKVLARFFEVASREKPADYGRDQVIDWKERERIAWQHQEIAAAIRDRDLGRAQAMMRLHHQGLLSLGTDSKAGGSDAPAP